MNKKKFLLFLLTLVILPVNVLAFTGDLVVDCDKSFVTAGNDVKCTITGSSDTDIIDISAEIKLTSNLEFQSFDLDSTWVGNDFDDGKISIYTESGDPISGDFNLGVLNLKVKDGSFNSNETVRLSNIEYIHTANEYTVGDKAFSIRIPSNVNTLDTLTVEGATINFNKDTINYDVEVNVDKTTISATKTDERATVTGEGEKTLKYGGNTFVITVTAEDGSKKEYTLNITRPDGRSSENSLLNFSFYNHSLSFNKDNTVYNLNVENNISKIAFCTENKDSSSILCVNKNVMSVSDKAEYSVSLDGDSLKTDGTSLPLITGNNELKIVVTAENGGKKTYTFNINRKTINSGGNVEDNDDDFNDNGYNKGEDITENPSTSGKPILIVLVLAILLGIYIFRFDFSKNVES